jgi:hypothetical protein
MKLTKRAMIIPAASLLLGGCGLLTTPPKNEYAAFAEAGSGYTEAVGKVIDAAGKAQVDSSSWLFVKNKDSGGVSEESYNDLTEQDGNRLKILQHLKDHSNLLGLYFHQLNSLATSDATEKTKGAIEGVVKHLADLSPALNASYPDVSNSLPQLTSIAVDLHIRGTLREELDKRKDVIRKELCIQELLLKRLSKDIADGLQKEVKIKEYFLVKRPITSKDPLEKPEEWVAQRRETLYLPAATLPAAANEAHAAGKVAEEMRKTFEALLTGDKDAMAQINALVKNIKSILAVAKASKS